MRKNKLTYFLFSMLAVIVAIGAMIFTTSGKVLAEGEDIYGGTEYPSINCKYNFDYNPETGWYESSGGYYRLLTQSKLVEFNGHLPDDSPYTGMPNTYVLYENIELTHGLNGYENKQFFFDLNGKTITYNPADSNEYFLSADLSDGELPCSCSFSNGTILNPKGAPLFRLGGNSTVRCRLNLNGITLDGGASTLNADGISAITLYNGAECTLGGGTVIKNFTSKRGAAVCCTLNGYNPLGSVLVSVDEATITNCYAYEGGAIYSEAPVSLAGNTTYYSYDSSPYHTVLKNNYAELKGGAVCLDGTDAYIVLGTCEITNNVCGSANTKTTGGGAIFCGSDSGREVGYFARLGSSNQYNCCCTAYVSGNEANGNESNLYFADNGVYDCLYVGDKYWDTSLVKIGISRNNASDGDRLVRTSESFTESSKNCFYCDDEYFSVERADKSYSGGYYSLIMVHTNGVTDPTVLKGLSLIIDDYRRNVIGLKIYVYIPDESVYPELSNWSGTLTPTSGNKFYMAGDEVVSTEVVKEQNILKITFPIDVEDMTVPLVLSVKYDGSEVLRCSGISVSSYAAAVLENPGKYGVDKSEDIVIALVNYGAASQKFFKFRTDDLADKILSSDQKAKITNFNMDNILNDSYYDGFCHISGKRDKIKITSMSVIFGATPTLKLYYSVQDGVTPVFMGYSESVIYEAVDQGNGVYTVKIPCSQYFAEMYEVNAYDSADLSTRECQISVNIAYYMRNCYVTEGYSANMKNLAKSYLIYVYTFLDYL